MMKNLREGTNKKLMLFLISSVSSYANSSASLIWQDLLSEMNFFKGYSNMAATRMLKFLSAVIGASAIGFAMLVKQLGSIVAVTNSFLNALGGSMIGIFIAGMFAPWVNTKGAYAGFITTLSFNMWLLVGQFITGFEKPEMLPLSIEGCPKNLYHLNSTSKLLIDYPTENLSYSTKMPEDEPHEEQMEKSIYDLSFCYTGVIAIFVYYIVASLISVLTGPLKPSVVDVRLIHPRCLKLYKRLWGFFDDSFSADKESAQSNTSGFTKAMVRSGL
ncbi:sodium-coupled monocarboxylate transporter 1-like [Macrobrachium nipponense]|uniref:sodium-coupled monocarboxylate transporter 1-like n=1 Tax=Macrobrachium nipponense TaxID=159736 RepID=UPI0030C83AFE